GRRDPPCRERDRVTAWSDVADVDHIGPLAAVSHDVACPGEPAGQSLRVLERERLPRDAIRLPAVEDLGGRQGDRGYDHRIGREPATQFDMTAGHPADVGRIVLRDEEVTHRVIVVLRGGPPAAAPSRPAASPTGGCTWPQR